MPAGKVQTAETLKLYAFVLDNASKYSDASFGNLDTNAFLKYWYSVYTEMMDFQAYRRGQEPLGYLDNVIYTRNWSC